MALTLMESFLYHYGKSIARVRRVLLQQRSKAWGISALQIKAVFLSLRHNWSVQMHSRLQTDNFCDASESSYKVSCPPSSPTLRREHRCGFLPQLPEFHLGIEIVPDSTLWELAQVQMASV